MIYTVNNIQFAVINKQVLLAGKVIQLSPRGHQCLILFLTTEQQTLSKERLLKTLWPNVIVSDDSLFKVIQEVRKGLRASGLNEDLISNVYGKGYQLQANVTTKPRRTVKPYFLALLPILMLCVLSIYILNADTLPQISNTSFERQIALIEAGQKTENFTAQLDPQNAHPTDQLKVAYLKGFQLYKSGDYDNSIESLLSGIETYGDNPSIKVLADSYLLLSRMYIYRADKAALVEFLDQADHHYSVLDDTAGEISTAISRARYHQAIFQFPESIVMLNAIWQQAVDNNDRYNQMRAISNLAYSYQQTNQTTQYVEALQHTLDLALAIPDGNYAAYAYGALSQHHMSSNQYSKAMKFAQQALKYVLKQSDTNNFQQGYSAFYNLLPALGHTELAATHLQSAIDLQAHFNNESLLVAAEINLAKVHITQQNHQSAGDIFNKLLTVELTTNELHEITALEALNNYYMQDNIAAYTAAKQVMETTQVDDQTRFIAGTALAFSSHQLERNAEAIKAFKTIEPLSDQSWIFAQHHFLNLAVLTYTELAPNDQLRNFWMVTQSKFEQDQVAIKQNTLPDASLMTDVNSYIYQILNRTTP